MAVAEARAVWQRTVNRCFVQEDAKRAPKLPLCPSTSSPTTKQVESGGQTCAGQDTLPPNFSLLKRNPSYASLPQDSEWWLQSQPSFTYQRGLTDEQIKTMDGKLSDVIHSAQNSDSAPDTCDNFSKVGMEREIEVMNRDLKTFYNHGNKRERNKVDNGEESYKLVDASSVGSAFTKEVSELGLDSWIWVEKTEPWWRTADKHELASFVAQKSQDLIDNCDLPQPQNTNFKRDPVGKFACCNRDGFLASSDDFAHCIVSCAINTDHSRCVSRSASVEVQSLSGSGKPPRTRSTKMPNFEIDPTTAQLLDALRHSQTRARQAEKAAKEAIAEKEHMVKLVFRQASHLFAYKQWFYLLQLENISFHLDTKALRVPPLFPTSSPSSKNCPEKKAVKRGPKPFKGRTKRELRGYDCSVNNYVVVLALGLGLVGAGLLLGWTMGWMLPIL